VIKLSSEKQENAAQKNREKMRVKTNKGGKEGKKETIKVWPSLH
jgi:hypothetical protein